MIDYKAAKYKLFIGQTKDSIDKILELKRDLLADDGRIADTGISHYMNIGEDLVRFDKVDVLPALFF